MTYKPTLNSSVLKSRDEAKVNFARKIFGNHSLRLGLVLEILETDDEKNISKLGPEYNVLAIEQDGSNGSSTTVYKNCITIDSFGGAADYFQFKHRAAKDPKKASKTGSLKDETGSIVLILCLDGNSEKAVILKSIQNPSKGVILDKEKGHHAEGEFNGLNWTVDKDGALKVLFKSATEDDGTPKDDEAGGTFIEINNKGSFDVNDGDDNNYIRMDKPNGDIGLLGDENVGLTATNNNVGLNAGNNIRLIAKKDLIVQAEGKASYTTKQSYDIKTDGKFSVVGGNIDVRSDGLAKIEASSNLVLNGSKVLVGPSPSPAIIIDTKYLGTGNRGAPVISTAIGPFSSSVLISS